MAAASEAIDAHVIQNRGSNAFYLGMSPSRQWACRLSLDIRLQGAREKAIGRQICT